MNSSVPGQSAMCEQHYLYYRWSGSYILRRYSSGQGQSHVFSRAAVYLRRVVLLVLVTLFVVIQTGCTRYVHHDLVDEGLIESDSIESSYFQHRVFRQASGRAEKPRSSDSLHIYFEGDGHPWHTRTMIAADPTSTQSPLLQAMLQDDSESVHIGRPCYYQTTDSACGANWWTRDRYHPRVVDSLVEVVQTLAEDRNDLWLIGHSGGGSLAVLVGRRLNRPVKVLTISANLNHRAWTQHHGYSPLSGSLNPASDAATNVDLRELHWYATADAIILPQWIRTYCEQRGAVCGALEATHTEGWLPQWREILARSRRIFAGNANVTAPR